MNQSVLCEPSAAFPLAGSAGWGVGEEGGLVRGEIKGANVLRPAHTNACAHTHAQTYTRAHRHTTAGVSLLGPLQ